MNKLSHRPIVVFVVMGVSWAQTPPRATFDVASLKITEFQPATTNR